MKIKEVVQKAMLGNSTKDEMYNDICDKLNCSRHAAKVLVHCFIWECSEGYMEHMLKKEMRVQEATKTIVWLLYNLAEESY